MLVCFALSNAKVLSFALGNAKLPDASSFASQWNIGFNLETASGVPHYVRRDPFICSHGQCQRHRQGRGSGWGSSPNVTLQIGNFPCLCRY